MCNGCTGNLFGLLDERLGLSRQGFLAGSTAALGALVASAAPSTARAASGAQTIFRNGTVIPMAGTGTAQALAVANGKILAVGSESAVMPLKTPSTQIVDLDGRALLPGFIDPHQHTVTGALVSAIFVEAGYPKYKTRADVLALLKERVAAAKPGSWVYAMNYDNLLQGGDLSMAELDAVSADVPVMVYYINMHTAAANKAAFDLAFAKANIPDSVGELPGGGHYGRDASGKFDGTIYEETALKPFLIGVKDLTPAKAREAVLAWLQRNAAAGNTKIHEAGVLV